MSTTSDVDWIDPYHELYENPLNYEVWREFEDAGPNLARKLIVMLQSSEPLTSPVAHLLVKALEAGLDGGKSPHTIDQLQIRIANDGQRKPGHRKYREDQRRKSIARAKVMKGYRERFETRSLLSTLGEMALKGIEIPDKVSQRTIEEDEALYNKMRRWVEVDGYPLMWGMRGAEFVENWRKSEQAEEDFITYGAEFEEIRIRNQRKNRSE